MFKPVYETWKAEIKEVNNPRIQIPSWHGESFGDDELTRKYLIEFWGLEEPDVESYKLYKV